MYCLQLIIHTENQKRIYSLIMDIHYMRMYIRDLVVDVHNCSELNWC